MSKALKQYRVETRAITTRVYYIKAANEKDAEAASVDATPDHEEDEHEETTDISELEVTG